MSLVVIMNMYSGVGQTNLDHVAKFQGDRPRDLGERVAK